MIRSRLALALALAGCSRQAEPERAPSPDARPRVESVPEPVPAYDPLAYARARLGQLDNLEATIPPQCYTKTDGRANPCWVCHAPARFPNAMVDWNLQEEFDFSETGKVNYWTNLFEDRRDAIAGISDELILDWMRADNYGPLRDTLGALPADEYAGFRPDLDFAAGFDELGFARDGSGWRAIRYRPFPGAFWPTNGSADDVFIRLAPSFRQAVDGTDSLLVTRANLAILEASLASDPLIADAELHWSIEPIDEGAIGLDLDRDGQLEPGVQQLIGLPSHYVGAAASAKVRRGLYPAGTEFLHSVRYVDPERDWLAGPSEGGGASLRLKELRYSRKFAEPSDERILVAYAAEAEEKAEGGLPRFAGSPLLGMRNSFGWQLQGFIEDEQGRLRVQSEEEHYFCMGCHTNLGVTADQTFAFPRKLPGLAGWRYQDLHGMTDARQVRHEQDEFATYLARALAGDEFRSNPELLELLTPTGEVDFAALAGFADLHALLMPSRARALLLAKAYLVIVREQSFTRGREPVVEALTNVHTHITETSTGLKPHGLVYLDGSLRLAPAPVPVD